MFALEDRSEYGENSHQQDGVPKGNQTAAHCRADAVGGVVGTDVPPYIDPGTDEN